MTTTNAHEINAAVEAYRSASIALLVTEERARVAANEASDAQFAWFAAQRAKRDAFDVLHTAITGEKRERDMGVLLDSVTVTT